MRSTFGDYRSKMDEEQRRLGANAGRVQFQQLPSTSKSQFLRKAIIKPTGEEFRFNFGVNNLSLEDQPVTTTKKEVAPTNAPSINTFQYQPSGTPFKFNFGNQEDATEDK